MVKGVTEYQLVKYRKRGLPKRTTRVIRHKNNKSNSYLNKIRSNPVRYMNLQGKLYYPIGL